jgi:hypothetical protein
MKNTKLEQRKRQIIRKIEENNLMHCLKSQQTFFVLVEAVRRLCYRLLEILAVVQIVVSINMAQKSHGASTDLNRNCKLVRLVTFPNIDVQSSSQVLLVSNLNRFDFSVKNHKNSS